MSKLMSVVVFSGLMLSAVCAQDSTSMGIVGVSRVTTSVGGYHIAGMQYNPGQTNTPDSVYGDELPSGSKIYKWTDEGYLSSTYGDVFVPGTGVVTKWDSDLDLNSGEGYWIYTPSSVDAYLSGDVPLDDSITNSIVEGYQICSYPYPVDRVVTNLGFTPSSGDKIYVWDGSGYGSSTYGDVFVPGSGVVTKWDNEDLQVGVGQGFWYYSTVAVEWVVERPYSTE